MLTLIVIQTVLHGYVLSETSPLTPEQCAAVILTAPTDNAHRECVAHYNDTALSTGDAPCRVTSTRELTFYRQPVNPVEITWLCPPITDR